jgi:hypothetical protein
MLIFVGKSRRHEKSTLSNPRETGDQKEFSARMDFQEAWGAPAFLLHGFGCWRVPFLIRKFTALPLTREHPPIGS